MSADRVQVGSRKPAKGSRRSLLSSAALFGCAATRGSVLPLARSRCGGACGSCGGGCVVALSVLPLAAAVGFGPRLRKALGRIVTRMRGARE